MNRIEQAGRNAEDDARWHLDRCFGQSKNWRVIHDLTLPDHRSSSPCQIDHVVIGRLADVIVLETKSFPASGHLPGIPTFSRRTELGP